ncbi:MAG: RluA family pseudouridine synthase [Pyrinomonadaceae bacterium]
MLTKFQFHISEIPRKKRLDKYICEQVTAVSRMYLRYLIKEGKCAVNGVIEVGGYHLRKDDSIEIEVDIKAETAIVAEAIPLEIVYEDSELIVVNKPPEMLVHPTKGVRGGTLLNALTYYFNAGNESDTNAENFVRAGLVHRLDRKTSGLILISKNPNAHRVLSNHFQRKLVEKRYYALVEGCVAEDFGTINAPIGRNAEERFWAISSDGKFAESRFQVIERYADTTLLSLEPVTGRTNQLRLHCAHIGHPIIGDDKYGGREFPRLCLHAYKLSFWHPNGNQRLEFETELPKDFFR